MADQNQQSVLLGKIAAYTEILVKDQRSTIFVSLAEAYRKMGMLEDARQIISKGLELHPDFSPAHIVIARILCQLEDFTGSETAFERALELDYESLAALVGYARVKILLGQENEARELLLRARHLSPADPVINKLLLSLPEQQLSNEPDSEEDDRVEVAATPLVSSTLAELYLKQGLREEALRVYQELLLQKPDDLSLRRKIKELESGSDFLAVDLEENLVEEEDEGLSDAVSELGDQAVFSSVEYADDDKVEDETLPADPATEVILATLNRWLLNIQQRRGHV